MSAALYPKVFDEYAQFVAKYGPVDKLDTRTFLVGPDVEEEISVSKQMLYMTVHLSSSSLLCYVALRLT